MLKMLVWHSAESSSGFGVIFNQIYFLGQEIKKKKIN